MSSAKARALACAEEMASDCLAARARLVARVVSGVYQEELDQHGVTAAQVSILTALVLARQMSPAALSARLRLDKSTISRNLHLMIDHGWISAQGRGRGLVLAPTRRGTALHQAAYPAWQQAQRRTRALLGKAGARELTVLAAALSQ